MPASPLITRTRPSRVLRVPLSPLAVCALTRRCSSLSSRAGVELFRADPTALAADPNRSHTQLKMRKVYARSVTRASYLRNRVDIERSESLFLVPQLDYLRHLDCDRHSVHLLRTHHLDEDFRSLVHAYHLHGGSSASMHGGGTSHPHRGAVGGAGASEAGVGTRSGAWIERDTLNERMAMVRHTHNRSAVKTTEEKRSEMCTKAALAGAAKAKAGNATSADSAAGSAARRECERRWKRAQTELRGLIHPALVELSAEERAFVEDVLYPWDTALYRLAEDIQSRSPGS
jgi:hypothetical protein